MKLFSLLSFVLLSFITMMMISPTAVSAHVAWIRMDKPADLDTKTALPESAISTLDFYKEVGRTELLSFVNGTQRLLRGGNDERRLHCSSSCGQCGTHHSAMWCNVYCTFCRRRDLVATAGLEEVSASPITGLNCTEVAQSTVDRDIATRKTKANFGSFYSGLEPANAHARVYICATA
jgi:hypothetical protein